MAIAIILILCLRRKSVIAPFLWMLFTVPLGQVVVMGGVHFTVLRIIILAGLARWIVSGRTQSAGRLEDGFNSIDWLVILWAISGTVINTVQFMETQALIKNLGSFLDLLGGYLVLRFLIQDRDDVRRTLKVLAVITVVIGCCMIDEQMTGQNIFGVLGGVPLHPQVREGHVRSQGAFAVYIEAGLFGANLLPLFIWLWSDRKFRAAALLGMLGGTIMVITCRFSTPILAYGAAIFGFCLWRFRSQMRLFRQGLVFVLVMLHLVMKAPVWALIARIDLTGSSSGDHRFHLVDATIQHFSDWWLLGYKDYPAWGWGMWDLSDQYVAVALTGGLLTLVIFIWILCRSFSLLGKARKHVAGDLKEEWFLWCLGVALFANMVGWFGLACWAQAQAALSALLVIISVATFEAMRPREAEVEIMDNSELDQVPDEVGPFLEIEQNDSY
jgi:hypothetical protein